MVSLRESNALLAGMDWAHLFQTSSKVLKTSTLISRGSIRSKWSAGLGGLGVDGRVSESRDGLLDGDPTNGRATVLRVGEAGADRAGSRKGVGIGWATGWNGVVRDVVVTARVTIGRSASG